MNSSIYSTWILLQNNIPRKTRHKIAFIVFLSGLLEMLGLGIVFPLLKVLSDPSALENYRIFFGLLSPNYFIFIFLFTILVFYALKSFFLSYGTYKIFESVFFLQEKLSNKLFKGLLFSDYDEHRNLNVNKQSSILVNDIPLVSIEWYLPCVYIIADSITLSIILIFLGVFNPTLLLIAILIGGLIFGSTLHFSRRYSFKWGLNRKFHDDLKIDYFNNGLIHIKEIITYNKLHFYYEKFARANQVASRSGILQSTAQVLPKFLIELVAICVLVAIIFAMTIAGKDFKTILPAIGIYSVAAFRIIPSINRLMQSFQMVQYGAESAREVLASIDRDFDELSQKNESNLEQLFFEELMIEGLNYFYPSSKKDVLKNLSLVVNAGDLLAIVGDSGSGKSTLIDIILGLNKPQIGSLKVNKISLFDHIHSWRNIVGYVPQSTHLTSGSLLENITFNSIEKDIDYDLLNLVIEITGIKKNLGGDYLMSIGEGGIKISGGQRQRIAIARALYKKPLVLILDEATSALDRESENTILNMIKSNFKNITIIAVTHHLYNSNFFDRVYNLDNGSLYLKTNNHKPEIKK